MRVESQIRLNPIEELLRVGCVFHRACADHTDSVKRARHSWREQQGKSPHMGWKLLVGFVVLLALGAGALAIYGSRLEPPQRTIEETLPDSRFPK